MWTRLTRNRRLVAGIASALFIATAFNTGGCTVTVDENTMNQLLDWLDNLDTSGWGSPGPDPSCSDWSYPPCGCDCSS